MFCPNLTLFIFSILHWALPVVAETGDVSAGLTLWLKTYPIATGSGCTEDFHSREDCDSVLSQPSSTSSVEKHNGSAFSFSTLKQRVSMHVSVNAFGCEYLSVCECACRWGLWDKSLWMSEMHRYWLNCWILEEKKKKKFKHMLACNHAQVLANSIPHHVLIWEKWWMHECKYWYLNICLLDCWFMYSVTAQMFIHSNSQCATIDPCKCCHVDGASH